MKMSLTHLLGLACFVAMVVTCSASVLDALQDKHQYVKDEDARIVKRAADSKVAFSAYLDGNVEMRNSILIFNSEIYDAGNDYNSSTGVFTAPTNGTYLFYFQIEHWMAGPRQKANLYVQGDVKASCVIHPNGKSTQSSAMVILPLTLGDQVHVKVDTGEVYGASDERFTSFTGARLF